MPSKKLKLLLIGILSLFSFCVFSQDTGVFNVNDSTVIPKKGLAQQNEFMNNTYDFPAKPRNQLEIGVSTGLFSLSSDVSAKLPTFGFSAHVRKALGYIFSLRLQYSYGEAQGLNWKPSFGYANDPTWALHYSAASLTPVYYNYRTHVNDLALQGIFTLNNVRFHKQKSGMVIYVGVGMGATMYNTYVNALDANNNPYNFATITDAGYKSRKQIRKALKSLMDNTYESAAQNNKKNKATLFGETLDATGVLLGGVAFKLSNKINLAIEERFTMTNDDLLDGLNQL
jgi:hypothetical protein